MASSSDDDDSSSQYLRGPVHRDDIIGLLHLQKHIVQYSLTAIRVLQDQPDSIVPCGFAVPARWLVDIDLRGAKNLLDKYHTEAASLTDIDELIEFYLKLNDFTVPILTDLMNQVQAIKRTYEESFEDSEDEENVPSRMSSSISSSHTSSEPSHILSDISSARTFNETSIKNNIAFLLLHHVFPRQVLETNIKFIIDFTDNLKHTSSQNSTLASLDFPYLDELIEEEISAINATIKNYLTVYPASSPKSLYCFYQAIKKEVMFDPGSKIDDLEELTNTILAKINENESGMSPHSFTDQEVVRLELMEDLTFHVQIAQFFLPLVHITIASIHHKMDYYHFAPEYQGPVDHAHILRAIDCFIAELDGVSSECINGGSAGLSLPESSAWLQYQLECLYGALAELFSFSTETRNLEYLKRDPRNILFKEQLHFMDNLKELLKALEKAVQLVSSPDILVRNSASSEAFKSQHKSIVKTIEWTMLFEPRFKYEARILDVLVPDWRAYEKDQPRT